MHIYEIHKQIKVAQFSLLPHILIDAVITIRGILDLCGFSILWIELPMEYEIQ